MDLQKQQRQQKQKHQKGSHLDRIGPECSEWPVQTVRAERPAAIASAQRAAGDSVSASTPLRPPDLRTPGDSGVIILGFEFHTSY